MWQPKRLKAFPCVVLHVQKLSPNLRVTSFCWKLSLFDCISMRWKEKYENPLTWQFHNFKEICLCWQKICFVLNGKSFVTWSSLSEVIKKTDWNLFNFFLCKASQNYSSVRWVIIAAIFALHQFLLRHSSPGRAQKLLSSLRSIAWLLVRVWLVFIFETRSFQLDLWRIEEMSEVGGGVF